MAARIINLGYYNALRTVDAGIAEVKAATNHAIALLQADTERRRERIDEQLAAIEADVRAAMPSDSAFPEGA